MKGVQHEKERNLCMLNTTGEISLWKALKQSWMLLAYGNDQVSVVFQKKLLTTETFLIIVELTNIS